jgi:hypothetical protein
VRVLRFVAQIIDEIRPADGRRVRRATLELATAVPANDVSVLEGALAVEDGADYRERFDQLGFSPEHPRWLAAVLTNESVLAFPDESWIDKDLAVDLASGAMGPTPALTPQFTGGLDRYDDIVADDFFDPRWVPGDERPARGVHALADHTDVALLVVPDLYSPAPLGPPEDVRDAPMGEAEFVRCEPPPPPSPQHAEARALEGLRLDPRLSADLERIVSLQQRLVEFAERCRSFVVLLDVPPGLRRRSAVRWRSRFASAYAVAYHPWLHVARNDDARARTVLVNPAGAAAGVVAQREHLAGVHVGPANVLVEGVVGVGERVEPDLHAELHQLGVNVYLLERDGVRLTAARTLSRDREWRQLSVRRLLTMIARTLARQMQWTAFEPNNAALRSAVRHLLEAFLGRLFAAGAFTGEREEQAFFVRCDDELNPPAVVDAGRLVAHVGVAPAEPVEFIVLEIARDADGTIHVEV